MKASRRLELVVNNDGEVVSREEKCEHCAGYERDLKGYRLRLAKVERDLANAQGSEPEAAEVRRVLDYWADRVVEERWWHRRPTFKPGDNRWVSVRARVKDGKSFEECCHAIDGALGQGREVKQNGRVTQIKREWVDADSIFRNNENFEKHVQRFLDPDREWVRKVQELPTQLRDRFDDLVDAAAMCDCGHLRFDHAKWDPLRDGRSECLVHGCHCTDWDDTMQRTEEYLRRSDEATRGQGGG